MSVNGDAPDPARPAGVDLRERLEAALEELEDGLERTSTEAATLIRLRVFGEESDRRAE